MESYVFLHVPLSTGLNLWSAFVGLFGRDNVSQILPADALSKPPDVDAARRFRMVFGHLSRETVEPYFYDRAWLSVLRDPIDRCVATYYFFRGRDPNEAPWIKAANELEIHDYFNQPEVAHLRNCSNRAVRQLGAHSFRLDCNLREATENAKRTLLRCKWVGFYERLADDLSRLKQFGDFKHLPDPAQEPESEDRMPVSAIDSALYRRLVALNQYDIELYHWARTRWA